MHARQFSLIALIVAIFVSALFPATVSAQALPLVWKFSSETIADNSCFAPNTPFEKKWTISNAGSLIWSSNFHFDFVSGTQMSTTTSMQLGYNVDVNNTIKLQVNMIAPATPGTYTSNWSLKDANNTTIPSTNGNSYLWVTIVVSQNCNTANSSVNGNSLPVQQNGVSAFGSTPQPVQFDFYTQGNTAYTYINGQWVVSTVSPNGKYVFPQVSGTVNVYDYQACTQQWVWNGWGSGYQTSCVTKQRGFQEIGLMPTTSIDPAGVVRFYKFLNALSFGMVGTIANGTIAGQGGYTITYLGEGGSVSASSVAATLARFAVPVLVVGYITYSSGIFIVTYPIRPVTAPTAPAASTSVITLAGLYGARALAGRDIIVAMSGLLGVDLLSQNLSLTAIDLSWVQYKTMDREVLLPRGTKIKIEVTWAGNMCQTKSFIDFLFPSGKREQFQGFSHSCNPWALFESLIDLVKYIYERFKAGFESDLVRQMIDNIVRDILQMAMEYAKMVLKSGL
jgi:hypothetical protein